MRVFLLILLNLCLSTNIVHSYVVNQSDMDKKCDEIYINKLILDGRYKEINSILEEAISASEKDIENEKYVVNALNSFNNTNKIVEETLNDWVSAMPGSYVSYLARGSFYLEKATQSRGDRFISETSIDQLNGMEFFLKKAYSDLNKSLEIKPNLIPAYSKLMFIALLIGDKVAFEEYYKKGIAINNYSATIRMAYAQGLTPRWGGSVEQLRDFVQSTKPLIEKNSRLKIVTKYPLSEAGYNYLYSQDYEKAIKYFGLALEQYPTSNDHYRRGEAYFFLQKYTEALSDFNAAIEINPNFNLAILYRAHCYLYGNKLNEALEDANSLIDRNPNDPEYYRTKGLIFFYMKKYDDSEKMLLKTLELDPSNDNAKRWLERVKNKQKG